ncbi:hypothetical protein Efla_007384 [Eimeria flavescens]
MQQPLGVFPSFFVSACLLLSAAAPTSSSLLAAGDAMSNSMLRGSGVWAALLPPQPTLVKPTDLEFFLFSSRLARGELRSLGSGGNRFVYLPPHPAAAAVHAARNRGSSSQPSSPFPPVYSQAAADFLSACPVFFVADRRGRLLTASYEPADPQAIPPLTGAPAAAAGAARGAAAAAGEEGAASSTPGHVALSLGLFFMSPSDAAEYLHAAAAGSSLVGLSVKSMPLSEAYPWLRYIHPGLRQQARKAHASFRSKGPAAVFFLLLSTGMQKLLRKEATEADRLRCVLMPDSRTLAAELQQRGRRGAPLRGTPVFVLPPLGATSGSRLQQALQQQQPQGEAAAADGREEAAAHYRLEAVQTGRDQWSFAVRFKGSLRMPVFCSRADAAAAPAAPFACLPLNLPNLSHAIGLTATMLLEQPTKHNRVTGVYPTKSAEAEEESDGILDDILQEYLQNAANLLVNQPRNALYSASSRQTPDGRLGDTLNVIPQNLPVALRAPLSQSLSSFSSARHFE